MLFAVNVLIKKNRKEELIKIFKIFDLINNIEKYQKDNNDWKKNIDQEFKLKERDNERSY